MATTTALMNANWNDVLTNINPFAFASVGSALALTLCVIGAAWGIFITGSTILGSSIKAPRIRSKNLISVIFCEATAIYGVIIAIIIATKVQTPARGMPTTPTGIEEYYRMTRYAAYALFWSGVSVGLTNVASGVSVGVAGSACAISDAADASLFVKILIVEIFGSALGIFGVIVAIIMQNPADQFSAF